MTSNNFMKSMPLIVHALVWYVFMKSRLTPLKVGFMFDQYQTAQQLVMYTSDIWY
jgi:hypothetical protein